jgi:hypothetical protein
MTPSRPWWASEGPVDGGVDREQDPLDAHRAARRGSAGADTPDRGTSDADDGAADDGAADDQTQTSDAAGRLPPGSEICGVCPVCIAARMLGETRPELLVHLTEVGRHLSAALRALLETPADRGGRAGGQGPDDRGVRRIDLD